MREPAAQGRSKEPGHRANRGVAVRRDHVWAGPAAGPGRMAVVQTVGGEKDRGPGFDADGDIT